MPVVVVAVVTFSVELPVPPGLMNTVVGVRTVVGAGPLELGEADTVEVKDTLPVNRLNVLTATTVEADRPAVTASRLGLAERV